MSDAQQPGSDMLNPMAGALAVIGNSTLNQQSQLQQHSSSVSGGKQQQRQQQPRIAFASRASRMSPLPQPTHSEADPARSSPHQGGNLPTEDAVDLKPGQGEVQDLPGDKEHLKNLGGDVGTVKGAGLGVVQGGVDERGGTEAPTVAEQTDTGKLDGSKA